MTTVQFQTSTPRKPGGFADLFEQSVAKADTLKEGDIVSGTVIAVGKDHVVVDIGYKSEGVIRVDEFAEPAGGLAVKVGDQVDVLVESKETDDGLVLLSKEKAPSPRRKSTGPWIRSAMC